MHAPEPTRRPRVVLAPEPHEQMGHRLTQEVVFLEIPLLERGQLDAQDLRDVDERVGALGPVNEDRRDVVGFQPFV